MWVYLSGLTARGVAASLKRVASCPQRGRYGTGFPEEGHHGRRSALEDDVFIKKTISVYSDGRTPDLPRIGLFRSAPHMCGGGTPPILGRSGVPAISRPPPGGGVGNVLGKWRKGGGYLWKRLSCVNSQQHLSTFLSLKSITQTLLSYKKI